MRKVQATITLQILDGAGLPEGIPDGGAVCVSGYADGGDLLPVIEAAKADAIERVRAARSGKAKPFPKAHELLSLHHWRCPCDSATRDFATPEE